MAVGRGFHACLILDQEGKVLVAGGFTNSWAKTKTVESYDIEAGTWSQLGDMPVLAQYFFNLGSTLGARNFDSPAAYVYDLGNDRWDRLAKDVDLSSRGYMSFDVDQIATACSQG